MDPGTRRRVVALVRKEWAEFRRNRAVVGAAVVVPTVLCLVAVGELLAMQRVSTRELHGAELPLALQGRVANQAEALVVMVAQMCLTLFLIMPGLIPSIMGAHAIVGEKQARTLEPLLATPLRTGELVAGKMIACVIPGVAPAWIAYGLYTTLVRMLEPPNVVRIITGAPWLLTTLLVGPLLAVLSVTIAMMISSRVNEVQSAQSLSGLISLPIVGLGIGQMTGVMMVSSRAALVAAAVLAVLDVGMWRACVALFGRETILTRWR